VNRIAFITANFVARETGWAMRDWGHGDRTTTEAFTPIETFPERFGALCGDAAALGFDTIDVWGGHLGPHWATDAHLDAALAALAEHGLSVASYQVYATEKHLERACEIAEALGATVLSGFVPVEDERLPGLLDRHRLRFGLENHPEPTAQTMLDKIGDDPRLGVCVDTGWFAIQGYDPARAIDELGPRVLHVHLKDVLHRGEPHETCRWGDGVVDAEACVRALQRIGYSGAIAIEHEPDTYDPSEDLRSMRAELAGWLP
jgi:sugar phosphate isomerase/epimerase